MFKGAQTSAEKLQENGASMMRQLRTTASTENQFLRTFGSNLPTPAEACHLSAFGCGVEKGLIQLCSLPLGRYVSSPAARCSHHRQALFLKPLTRGVFSAERSRLLPNHASGLLSIPSEVPQVPDAADHDPCVPGGPSAMHVRPLARLLRRKGRGSKRL